MTSKVQSLGSEEQLTWVVLVETWGPNTRKRSAPFGWMYVEPSIHQPDMHDLDGIMYRQKLNKTNYTKEDVIFLGLL